MCLATMAYVYTVCRIGVIIFSIGGKFQPVSKFDTVVQSYSSRHPHLIHSWTNPGFQGQATFQSGYCSSLSQQDLSY